MSAPRLLAPTTISGGVPTAGAGTLNTIALWTPDGNTLGNSLLTQSGNIVTNASGAIRAAGTTQTSPAFTRHDTTTSGIYFPATNEIGFTISNQHAMFISSGRLVGIGTESPGARLHCVGADGSYQFAVSGTTKGIRFLTTASVAQIDAVDQTLSASYQPLFLNGSTVTLAYSGAAALTVNNTGFVGIGTTSPSTRLHVSDNSSIPVIVQSSGSTDSYLRFINTSNNLGYIGYVGTNLYLAPNNGAGNVGIGTASPVTKLDVADANLPSGVVGIRSLYTGTITANAGGVLALGGYFTGTSPTTFAYIVGGKDNATAGDFGGHLQFITRPNGGVYAERARIDSAGNFGIGTASPGAILHTLGTGTTTGIFATTSANAWVELRRSTSTTLGYIGTGAGLVTGGAAADLAFRCESGNLLFSTGATERARIDSAGNVGIGTTSPTTFAASGSVVLGQNITSQQWALKIFGGNDANRAPVISLFRAGNAESIIGQIKDGTRSVLALGTGGGVASFNDATLATYSQLKIGTDYADMSGTGYGLKLPATPGATGAGTEQILDCYEENTWTPTLSGFGGTAPTVQTARYTRIGRMVVCNLVLVATGGNQFSASTGTPTYVTLPFTPATDGAAPVTNSGVAALGPGLIGTNARFYIPTFALTTATTSATIIFTV